MLGIDLKVDDFSFSNLFVVNEVQRPIYSVENTVESNGNLVNGSQLLASKISESKINMLVTLISDVLNDHNSIKQIEEVLKKYLPYRALAKISFSDDPDWYYLGKLDGDASINVIDENLGTLNLTFLVPDGIKHAVNPKGPFTATRGADGRYSVTVVNEGNVNAPITMTATMNAENGYIGMYTDYGITEIGNKEEADGQDYQQTETFLDTTTFNEDNWSNWSGTYTPDHRFDLSGTLAVSGVAGQKGLQKATTGANTGLFNGGCKVYTLPADSEGEVGAKNLYALWDTFFWAEKMGQTAVQDIIFWSSNEIIARWLVLKTDKNGNSAVCRASYNDGAKIQSIPNYNFGFKSSHLNTQNPFSASRGSMDFLKEGAKLQFYYWGRYYAVNVPALADKKVTKVSIALANYNKRTGNNYVTHNAIQKLQIRKLKVDKWRNVPNRYSDSDIVKMTGADSKVYVNDMPKLSEKVDGSNLFTIPPGETTIYFQCSDWCTTAPTYQIEFSEANL